MSKELKEIFLNRSNVDQWQEEDVHSFDGRECLKKHLELNEALCDALGNKNDWGGRYAGWLNNIGIEHQTDEGWWNETSVCRDNLLCFVEFYSIDEENDMSIAYNKRKESIDSLPKDCRVEMKSHYVNIREILEV